MLDMAFDEDRCRIRRGHGPDNFALLRKIAVNLLKAEKTCKRGIEGKRKHAAWNPRVPVEGAGGRSQPCRLRSDHDVTADSRRSRAVAATGSEGGAMLPRQASDGTADGSVWHR